MDGPPGGVLPLELELLCPPLLDRRPPEYRVQVQRYHKQVAHVGELPLGRLGYIGNSDCQQIMFTFVKLTLLLNAKP